jgi:hypothetical protein
MMLLLLSCLASCCLGSASLRASPALDDLLAPSPPGDAAEPRRLASLNDRLYVKHLDGTFHPNPQPAHRQPALTLSFALASLALSFALASLAHRAVPDGLPAARVAAPGR